jgi:hypothetical protein
LENIQDFFEDSLIREIRQEKEKQIKKEEDDRVARIQYEKVLFDIHYKKISFYLFFTKFIN